MYVWRNNFRYAITRWVGPGLVVAINAQQSSVWVSMRGVVVKCNIERVRPATDEEWLGSEILRVLSADGKANLERWGQRGYVDATKEDGLEGDDFGSSLGEEVFRNRDADPGERGGMPAIPEDQAVELPIGAPQQDS